jgi:hypothetical protein
MGVIGWRGASYLNASQVVVVISAPDHTHLTCASSPSIRCRQISLLTHLPQLLLSLRVDGLVAALQELLCGQLPPNALTLTAAKVRSFCQAARAALHFRSHALFRRATCGAQRTYCSSFLLKCACMWTGRMV